MVAEAERYAEQDRQRREQAETLNDADAICYQAERTLAEHGDKIGVELRERIETALRDTRQAVAAHDAEQASQQAEHLKAVLQEAGAALYGRAAPTPPEAGAAERDRDQDHPGLYI
jgi:molecular chaperone DnaK